MGGFARHYTPKNSPVNVFKDMVRLSAKQAHCGRLIKGAVICNLTFVMPRPKSKIWKTKPMPRYPHIIKPDKDNLEKAVLDSLTGIIWKDDCQVFTGKVAKWVAAGDEEPHVDIEIHEQGELCLRLM